MAIRIARMAPMSTAAVWVLGASPTSLCAPIPSVWIALGAAMARMTAGIIQMRPPAIRSQVMLHADMTSSSAAVVIASPRASSATTRTIVKTVLMKLDAVSIYSVNLRANLYLER